MVVCLILVGVGLVPAVCGCFALHACVWFVLLCVCFVACCVCLVTIWWVLCGLVGC